MVDRPYKHLGSTLSHTLSNKKFYYKKWLLSGTMLAFLAACGGSDSSDPNTPDAPGDPLYSFQWHLDNQGQTSFSSEAAVAGIDLNVKSLFMRGDQGQDVPVLVLDDGIDINHPDLAPNIDSERLANLDPDADNPDDPTPTDIEDAHGTAVSGIIAAVANNGLGGRGVAPLARLGGANLLACGQCFEEINELDVMVYGGAPFSASAWVVNGSYGSDPTAPNDGDIDIEGAALSGLAHLRDGKGSLLIKSGGNAFTNFLTSDGNVSDQCDPANEHELSCQNTSFDAESLSPHVVVVAAVNARGVRSSYSTAGSSLLVAGLGGEYGLADPPSPHMAGPALISTDLSGCEQGYVRQGKPEDEYTNSFETPGSDVNQEFNADCNYTSAMNGTSAAAPTVTGVVALILAANPSLTARDIRQILMKTSRKVDPQQAQKVLNLKGSNYIAEPAWVQNKAGYWFSNWYGFGLVDAEAAVSMAKNTTFHLQGNMNSTSWLKQSLPLAAQAIPIEDAYSQAYTQAVAQGLTIEFVQLRLKISGTAPIGDLGVELIAPSGTRSVLMSPHNAFQLSSVADALTLASNAFNGESALGNWQLRIVDTNGRANANLQAKLETWELRVLGH